MAINPFMYNAANSQTVRDDIEANSLQAVSDEIPADSTDFQCKMHFFSLAFILRPSDKDLFQFT